MIEYRDVKTPKSIRTRLRWVTARTKLHCKNRIVKITNVLVCIDCKDANYNLIGHTGCCYDCMIKDTCTIINYLVQYLILDAQRRFGNLKRFN